MDEVRLRAWRASDAPAIAVMVDDPHIRRWSSMGSDVEAWIARQQAGTRGPSLAICLADDDRALGKVAVRLPGHASPATTCAAILPSDAPVGEASYWLIPSARGRGLAAVAVREMTERSAATTTLCSLVLDVETTNSASIRVAERLGAERREPERIELDRTGVAHTLVVFVLPVRRRDC
jgi:RimJ/RimL family protein N-acetyltransferase